MEKTTSTFVPQAGMGALFAHANRDTGEIEKITGQFTTPEGLKIYLDCKAYDDGCITMVGTIDGIKGAQIDGFLNPEPAASNPETYKRGQLTVVGKKLTKTYRLNSKVKYDRNGLPYRFIWMSNNRERVAF